MNVDRYFDELTAARTQLTIEHLRAQSLSVVTAESCTAGLLAAALSKVEGAGDILHGGFVCYSKQQKIKALGVPADLIAKKTAVAEEVAEAMAQGALERSPADVAIAVTGVLGPEPDEDGNPVGLVYIARASRLSSKLIVRHPFGALPHDELCARTLLASLDLLRA